MGHARCRCGICNPNDGRCDMSGEKRSGIGSALLLSAALIAVLSLFGWGRQNTSSSAGSNLRKGAAEDESALFVG